MKNFIHLANKNPKFFRQFELAEILKNTKIFRFTLLSLAYYLLNTKVEGVLHVIFVMNSRG